ncbi:MAG: hypothetical protein ACRCYS_17095 [Beijerinckiaceae bacterium]
MRGLKFLPLFFASFLASPTAHAQDIKIRGNYTAKNVGALFQQMNQHRGKTITMDVKISMPEKGAGHEVRASHCWVQIIDKKSKRVIEFFNTRDYESGPLTVTFRDLWEIQNIGTGKRRNHCGSDPKDVHAPNPGYILALNPVG